MAYTRVEFNREGGLATLFMPLNQYFLMILRYFLIPVEWVTCRIIDEFAVIFDHFVTETSIFLRF